MGRIEVSDRIRSIWVDGCRVPRSILGYLSDVRL